MTRTYLLLYAALSGGIAATAGYLHIWEAGHSMGAPLDFVLHVVMVVGIVVCMRFFEGYFHSRIGPDRSIEHLQKQLDELSRERENNFRKVQSLESQVELLTQQLQNAMKHLGVLERDAAELRTENALLKAKLPMIAATMPSTPLLHICGDLEFGRQDMMQLNRARVSFRTLDNPTKDKIENEMQYRREDGTPYWWILISAHGSKDGILLEDGIAPPWWWNRVIDRDTQLVVLANCDGPEVGTALAGIARRVIVMYGDIQTEDASAFVLALFRAKMDGRDADEAFNIARRQVPQIASKVDIRRA